MRQFSLAVDIYFPISSVPTPAGLLMTIKALESGRHLRPQQWRVEQRDAGRQGGGAEHQRAVAFHAAEAQRKHVLDHARVRQLRCGGGSPLVRQPYCSLQGYPGRVRKRKDVSGHVQA